MLKMSSRIHAAMLMLALLLPWAHGAPYLPGSGAVVVEVLPRRTDPAHQELQRMRARLSATPDNLALATALAQRYIAAGRRQADPRYLGYAQAALAPWWRLPAPPAAVRILRATMLQSTHNFAPALADLDALVAADPANVQAWLTRATILTVQGDYSQATASCARLSRTSPELVSITCIANIAGMSGRASGAERLLASTLARNAEEPAELQVWALTLLAEMAARRGDAATAEMRFKRALALDPQDSYLLGAYADLLLDLRRPQHVIDLLKDKTRVDGLLLRHALALQQLPRAADALRAVSIELGARFNAATQRGDTVHQREQARYELQLRGDAKTALALAQRNWAVQKESADMRIYLEAANAARDAAAAAPVLAWIKRNGVEDVALTRLAAQLSMQAHRQPGMQAAKQLNKQLSAQPGIKPRAGA
jgi:tetratricopeptide (TPR) repeat protein